ncbi:MAG: hypothetical protein OXB98_23025 [Bryobacterales bacterium]|nr:hypothetical protein [Bryobacterales bacterium]
MATPAEPITTESTGALFRALRSAGVEADLAYRADDEVRAQAGQNVITVLGAKIDAQGTRITEFKAEMDTRFAELKSETAEIRAETKTRIEAQTSRIDSLADRVDTLQKVLWPLVIVLSVALLSVVGAGLFALLRD